MKDQNNGEDDLQFLEEKGNNKTLKNKIPFFNYRGKKEKKIKGKSYKRGEKMNIVLEVEGTYQR